MLNRNALKHNGASYEKNIKLAKKRNNTLSYEPTLMRTDFY